MSKASLKNLSANDLEVIALRFRALGEPSRLNLLRSLQEKERYVTELVEITGLSQPNVSRHLALLVSAGLVGRRKDGVNVAYRVIDKSVAELCEIVCRSVIERRRSQ